MDIVKGFFDLCISEECIQGSNYEKTIKILYDFGYRTIAINQVIDEANLEPKKKKKKGESRDIVDIVPTPLELKKVMGCEDMTILNRLTVVFSNQDIMHKITKSSLFKKYNLIAILPASQQALQFTCSNIDADILSFDPMNKQQCRINRKFYNQLVGKGFNFEILYSPTISDSTQRKNTIHISHLYHTFGKSKNIIISSGATNSFLLRSPYDVINLGFIFGLSEEQSKNAITHCCRNVFINSVGRRHGKAVMFVENIEAEIKERKQPMVVSDSDEDEETDINQPAQKKIKSVN